MDKSSWLPVGVFALALGFGVVACSPGDSDEASVPQSESEAPVAGSIESVANGVATATTEQIAAYPLETCAVSGEPLGSMGAPIDYFANGTLVRLCCKNCIETLESEPDTYVTKVLAATTSAGATEE